MIRIVVCICWLLVIGFLPGRLLAQADTLDIEMVEVVAVAMRKDMVTGMLEKLELRDAPLSSADGLNNWLANRTNLVLRGYGPGSSYGVSIRGSSTSQTQLLLNGVPFENPGLATSDVSLLANGVASQMSIYRGSGAAYLGNASVGGSLLLHSAKPNFDETLSQSFNFGSFGSFGTLTKARYGQKRFAGSTRIFYRKADNDFLRTDPANRDQTQPQPNGAYRSKGIAQDFFLYSKGDTRAHIYLLAGENHRQIPPVESRVSSQTTQKDQSFRAQAIVNTSVKSVDLKLNTAVDHGFLNYSDPDANLDEDSEYTTLHIQGEARKTFGQTRVFLFGTFRDSYVLTEAYANTERRVSPSLVAGASRSFFSKQTELSVLLRQEFLNTKALPAVPVLSLSQKLGQNLVLKGSVGKAYRLPGLNDLYWKPGGNPDLKPESGWFQEAGLDFTEENEASHIHVSISAFHRVIDNWIQWVPGADYWSPRNVKRVRSRGLEGMLNIEQVLGIVQLKHSASATLAQSTNLEPMFAGDQSVDKQLIYIPEWSVYGREEIAFFEEQLAVAFVGKYFSERYTTTDNSRSLDSYFLVDVELSGSFHFKKNKLSLFAAARNIFDVQYRLQAAFAMPGIYYETGIKFNINLNKKSK